MNDMAWNDPVAGVPATGASIQDWLSWIDNNLRRSIQARALAEALVDCDPEVRLLLLESAHEFFRTGSPLVPLGNVMDEATFWADTASPAERKAYCLACYVRMPAEHQAAFLEYVGEKHR